MYVYVYIDDVSLTKNAAKAFLKPKWANTIFSHINFGLAPFFFFIKNRKSLKKEVLQVG